MTTQYERRSDIRIGLALPSKGPGVGPEELDAGASTASQLDWSSVWVTDHLLVPRGPEAAEYGYILEAITALAWVGARHEGLTLGFSVLVPAMRDAPLLAKQIATLDVLTGGRIVVGVGASDTYDLTEYTNLGKAERFADRGAYLDESIALWRHLWSGRTDPFTGRFHRLEDFTFLPLPVQGAAVPVWCGGRSARAVRRSVELADGYHAAQTGPDNLRERIPQILEVVATSGRPLPTLSVRCRVKPEDYVGPPYALAGTPARMIEDVVEFGRLGVADLIMTFDDHEPEALALAMRIFDDDVVAPARERLRSEFG